jgi:hypothetical protein
VGVFDRSNICDVYYSYFLCFCVDLLLFGLFNVFVSFVVCPMQRGEKGDKEGDFGQDGDFPIKIGSLVQ